MYCANLRKASSIAVFAVAFALSVQAALAQKASASSPTGASSAKTNVTTGSTPAGGGGSSSGSSIWTAGRGSFGSQKATQGQGSWGSGRGSISSGSSSWTAGKGSFPYARQPDGVWVEGSAPAPAVSKASASGLASGTLPPRRSPAPAGLKPAAPSGRSGGTSGKAQVSRASTGARNGAVSKSRAGAFTSPATEICSYRFHKPFQFAKRRQCRQVNGNKLRLGFDAAECACIEVDRQFLHWRGVGAGNAASSHPR